MGRQMTRYSRQVIPGRTQGEDGDEKAAIDSMIFGAKKKRAPSAGSDADAPDFLPPVDEDEADLLVGRSNNERRKNLNDRRGNGDRRATGRKSGEYAPLREQGGYRGSDDGKRGPILLVGAMLIVAVFGFVVWSAYREGFKGDEAAEVQTLADSGGFKRPYIDTREPAAPTVAEEAEVLDTLDGAPASSEVRPATPAAPAPVAAAPAPVPQSPVVAKPPAPLKTPAAAPTPAQPVRAATALTEPAPVSLTPAPAVKPAASPAPKPVAAVSPAGAKPVFAVGGAWVAQLASTGSEVGAIEEWGRLAKSWPELLGAAERSIQTADVNGQTRYRLRAGAFASKADAASFCAEVKAKGGNCLPAAK
ncbi:MAG: hypothetical protein B7Y90_10655 [Alphaproteobacteria bacterium 32-64-14]|nr:MAG: hypothetical protein B7Y90_10655 [Alphaproteobacteria bacterium 32-64-14]